MRKFIISGSFQVAILLLLFLASGCASSISTSSQASCQDPHTVHAVSQGWHVGLVVAAADLAAELPLLGENIRQEKYVEIGWGDRRYYQAENFGLATALRAILLPTDSVLHIAVFHDEPEVYFAGHEVYSLRLEQAGYRQLLRYIAGSFARTEQGGLIRTATGLYGRSWFYLAEGEFHAFNTCNTWMAGALGTAGYPVSRRTITASSLLNQLGRYSPDLCFPAAEEP